MTDLEIITLIQVYFWNQFAQSSYNNNGSILGDITVKAFVATSQSNVPRNINYLSLVELEVDERNNIPTFNLEVILFFKMQMICGILIIIMVKI